MMAPMDPVEFPPLVGRQGSQERMVHDFRPGAEPALAILQTQGHPLKLSRDRLLHFIRRHPPRRRPFRSFAPSRQIPEIRNQHRRQAVTQCSACSQRSIPFQALCQSAVGALVGEEKVLQYLRSIPLSSRSVRQAAGAGVPCCIFEFLPQTFEIGIHGFGSSTMIANKKRDREIVE